ncbi:hypothetical protein [Cesiribacter sp. SM1]|uniref:hypothetical protein n=1 Tax=Cesiribacter sp. SM1 TaxID=2861196 RepID=UPI001CD4AAC9|nr:hypothetical protein [Cesiribacter sp. SM1]
MMKLALLMKSISGLFVVAIISCTTYKVESTTILYGPEFATVMVPITCTSIGYDLIGLKKKKVTDQAFLKKLADEVEELEVDNMHSLSTKSVDVRLKCYINYKHKTDTLCLGAFSGTILNGVLMTDNEELLELIKAHVYVEEE